MLQQASIDEVRMNERARASSEWWLTGLYVVLATSALALVTLLVGDVIAAIESGDHPQVMTMMACTTCSSSTWPIQSS